MPDGLGDLQRPAETVLSLVPGPCHRRALALDAPCPALELARRGRGGDLEALVGETPGAIGIAAEQRELAEARIAMGGVAPRHPAGGWRVLDAVEGCVQRLGRRREVPLHH